MKFTDFRGNHMDGLEFSHWLLVFVAALAWTWIIEGRKT